MSKFVRRFCKVALFWRYIRKSAQPIRGGECKSMSSAEKSGLAIQKLREFGYAFNADGQLRKIDDITGEPGEEPFKFSISDDHKKNQEHYEQLADQIPEIVYDLLEQNGLCRTYVPEDIPQEQATFIFTNPQKLVEPKKLIVLIHGSGYVRAGQWARSLIINNSIDHGTQIPYIKRAQSLGYDILVTNTNDNSRNINGEIRPIPRLGHATAHARYVWEKYVMGCNPESVAIVAHSYGGAIAMDLANRFTKFFDDKVFAIALTDSAHFQIPVKAKHVVLDIACNWVSSSAPLDTEIYTGEGEMHSVSAGHPKHEWTSYSAFESVFKFLEEKYERSQEIGSTSKKAKTED
ncbi:FAM172 family protein homolog CG10038 isoform X1 [Bactrocera tryoni]|uniref:FAM172 family protein homolog CG10038 isoform X1 n=2 Tax=Bactrocera tryoni TaxID=59916 RepID=UPI001A96AAC0|nr:FAM172 family protein homolog CG10038 isoform X1 [Bactrocera tryoni]